MDLTKLRTLARKAGVSTPDKLDASHEKSLKSVSRADEDDFDHALLKQIVSEHDQALESYKREAGHGSSPEVQAYAKAMLPKLERHVRQARRLDASAR